MFPTKKEEMAPKLFDKIITAMPGKGTVMMYIHLIAPDRNGTMCVHFQDSDGVFGAEAITDLEMYTHGRDVSDPCTWKVIGEIDERSSGKFWQPAHWLLTALKKYHKRAES